VKLAPALLLAALWCALTYELTPASAALGLVVGVALSLLYRPEPSPEAAQDGESRLRRLARRLRAAALLAVSFFWDLITSSVRLGLHVLKPRHVWHMAIVPISIAPRSDRELTLLSTLITLTPGTLTIDVTPERDTLYVHVMAAADPTAVQRELERGVVRRVRRLFQ
jgi:multicomponent Na+:H+ antiporter subunit E